jgi:hypothetical protein
MAEARQTRQEKVQRIRSLQRKMLRGRHIELAHRLCQSKMCSVHLVKLAGMDQNVDAGTSRLCRHLNHVNSNLSFCKSCRLHQHMLGRR